ncbi:RrF2 family transcriptional regulator [Luteithermobacter gelatinilyticus]|uniref:RrF2 family transcriptional regulator n=1 Tax=Luteithermobacter gelatinilyticus TaxID=2582913 RepID=UPI001106749B|nr:Rrf2 family transcriptional regulator [Luteithermobacter gelatinilyticus]|tara:strand:- start:2107 stop:2562 length:456 start_codon:yes stop_codon:yes gene_type:complete
MFRLTKKMIYALEAVVDIAYNGRVNPVQSRDITQRQGIPQRYLEQVMQQLVRANILKGVRGPKGGYFLARERRRISVGEIVRVINELDAKSSKSEFVSKSEMGRKVINPLLDELNAEIMGKLDSITLQDLCEQASLEGVESDADKGFVFTI